MQTCPKGHNSTEADFCSECGAKIIGSGITELAAISTKNGLIDCPDCATPHEPDSGNFCEICGYSFLTGVGGGVPFTNVPAPVSAAFSSPTPLHRAPFSMTRWQVVISIDPSLATPDSPLAPDLAPITIPLTHPIDLIGRTSVARAIYPEIALDFDDAVSSRHATLTLQADGSLLLRDIGSSNGTSVNSREIAVGVDIPISSGDEITLGHWTRLTLISIA